MKKIIQNSFIALLLLGSVQANAGISITKFMDLSKATASFNCAYKGKKASKSCTVTRSIVKGSIHPMTKQIYGANEPLHLLTIKWPDSDVSRYLSVDSNEAINLEDNDTYRFKTLDNDEGTLDLRRGLIIQGSSLNEHVRIW